MLFDERNVRYSALFQAEQLAFLLGTKRQRPSSGWPCMQGSLYTHSWWDPIAWAALHSFTRSMQLF
jgi:hypothetical protein